MFEEIILGIILEKDLTGYDIKKIIENSVGVFYRASYGSLYPALKRMETKGYVVSYEECQGGRKKIFYHITDSGKQCFFDWLTTPMEVLAGTKSNLSKVYFGGHLPAEERAKQLQIYEKRSQKYLEELEELEAHLRQVENTEEFYYKMSTLYYGISVTKKTIEWCRHIREQKDLIYFVEEQ